MPTLEEMQQTIDEMQQTIDEKQQTISVMQQSIDDLSEKISIHIVWKANFVQLYQVIHPRTFPEDYDFEANAGQLIIDAMDHAKTLGQFEAAHNARKDRETTERSARAKVQAGDFGALTEAEKDILKKSI